ncbi:MAG TPA: cbb3-type cytochrome c oxidase subunit 3 [Tepidisphaeraceae bacterium]|nr:cbb3-type cytochrome c oxidase subunit 3 [Tepidisphaeraceae bacterium]
MFKEIFNFETVSVLSSIGLLIFFTVFLGIIIWAFTRSKRTVDRWSKLPLGEEGSSEQRGGSNHE